MHGRVSIWIRRDTAGFAGVCIGKVEIGAHSGADQRLFVGVVVYDAAICAPRLTVTCKLQAPNPLTERQPTMTTTPDNTAPIWRDLADQLTPEQIAESRVTANASKLAP